MTSMTTFIITHREQIDTYIRGVNPNQTIFNDEERRLWILNDEVLYNFAKSEGVNV